MDISPIPCKADDPILFCGTYEDLKLLIFFVTGQDLDRAEVQAHYQLRPLEDAPGLFHLTLPA